MKKLRLASAFALAIVILSFPEICVRGAQRSMQLWYNSVLPSLFPFLVLMPLLTGREACMVYERFLGKWMRPIFGLSGAAAPAVVVSMIAGSPGGSIALRQIAACTDMDIAQARRIAFAMGGVSPAYLVTGVGAVLLGSAKTGYVLAAIQAAAQMILLFIYGRNIIPEGSSVPQLRQESTKDPIRSAVATVLAVAGYMMVFSIMAELLAHITAPAAWFTALLDLPTGIAMISDLDFCLKLPVISALVGFGGICIGMQNIDQLSVFRIKKGDYLIARCNAALLSGVIAVCVFAGSLRIVPAKPISTQLYYSFSLLIVLLTAVPPLIILTNKLFLNKTKLHNRH